jgi:uncharacterized repeat protein (TIGR03803 family)
MAQNRRNRGDSGVSLHWIGLLAPLLGLSAAPIQGQPVESVPYNFAALPNGSTPYAGVIVDAAGELFGTASTGGAFGAGVVFKVDTAGNETVLYSFSGGKSGGGPMSGLTRDAAGNLYGTAQVGGVAGYGVVYKLEPNGQETVLHTFVDGADGRNPLTGVVLDGAGYLYGTTQFGGASHEGILYKVDGSGHETVIHTFTGGADGAQPMAAPTLDSAGNLYGTTAYGGFAGKQCHARNGPSGCGVVYKVDTSGNFSVLYTFSPATQPFGAYPSASVILDPDGNIYGTTWGGGSNGIGTIFELDSTGHQKMLFSFTGGNGQYPDSAVVRDASGNLYGVTYYGGHTGDCNGYDCGVVYKLDNTGHETILYGFQGGTDGGLPVGLAMDGAGNLYGSTQLAGPAYLGAVFKLDTTGKETALNALSGGASGNSPQSGLILDNAGNLYGTTFYGGRGNAGLVYKMAAGHETVLYSFSSGTGLYPSGNIVQDAAGNIYGTAISANGCCGPVLYKLDTTAQLSVLAAFGDNDGLNPGVIMDAAGNLYVTTSGGSAGGGAVHKVSPSGQTTTLYTFTGGTDGDSPTGNLTLDATGNLFGTTAFGGTANCGTVFKLSPSGEETILYNFTDTAGVDGGAPYAGVTLDASGNIYGTTGWGGAGGYGTVYKLDTAGHETILYSFTQSWPTGPPPYSSLVLDAAGNLYGTSYGWGTNCQQGVSCGTVYEVSPSGQYTLLHSFTGGTDGGSPVGPVLLDNTGHVFGTASSGGKRLGGVLYKITL